MELCLRCKHPVNFKADYYQIKKNGSKSGAKKVGTLCSQCYGELFEFK